MNRLHSWDFSLVGGQRGDYSVEREWEAVLGRSRAGVGGGMVVRAVSIMNELVLLIIMRNQILRYRNSLEITRNQLSIPTLQEATC